jgi:hypothetical protein
MPYAAIDGDMADFVGPQMELLTSFVLSDLRQYLLNEGHTPGAIEEAIHRWRDRWFVPAGEGFALTSDGRQVVEALNIR